MSSFFYPHRHHRPSHYGRHYLTPYGRAPASFSPSPWNSTALYRDTDPFSYSLDHPFHQPFLSLFNDTFSQLDRLSNDLNSQLNDTLGSDKEEGLSRMLTLAPKFDLKETQNAYILEGELPGVEKKDISLDFVDDNTLVLKTKIEKVREEGAKPEPAREDQGQIGDSAGQKDVQMSGANAEPTQQASSESKQNESTAVTTTNNTTDVAKPAENKPTYHLTERSIGTFQRVFSLPGELKHDEVKASLKNGVLTVTVPKVVKEAKEEKKSRSVTVEEVTEDPQLEAGKKSA